MRVIIYIHLHGYQNIILRAQKLLNVINHLRSDVLESEVQIAAPRIF